MKVGLLLAVALLAGGVDRVRDIPYYQGDDAVEKQRLDLYIPRGQRPAHGYPVFLFVHGGGWKLGDRKMYGKLGTVLAGEGILAVCISYRLSPDVRHPEHVKDVARSLRWVQDNIAEHGGDPARVCIGGHSAGGHLSALVCLDRRYLAAVGADPNLVRGVAAMSGVYDLARAAKIRLLRESMVIPAFGEDPAAWAAASPINYVRADAPPFWINNAEIDWGLQRGAEAFEQKLREAGVPVERTMTPDTNHITEITSIGRDGDLTTKRLLAFIRMATAVE